MRFNSMQTQTSIRSVHGRDSSSQDNPRRAPHVEDTPKHVHARASILQHAKERRRERTARQLRAKCLSGQRFRVIAARVSGLLGAAIGRRINPYTNPNSELNGTTCRESRCGSVSCAPAHVAVPYQGTRDAEASRQLGGSTWER